MLERAIDAGGEGTFPFWLSGPLGGKPPPFIIPLEPLETGGVIRFPRLFGEYGGFSSSPWYLEMPDHSLPPPIETGDKGPGLRFIVW